MNPQQPKSHSEHPPVIRSAWVRRPPQEAFSIFTDNIGAWWPLPTHGLFGDRAGGLSFHNGHLVEMAVDGTKAVWGQIRVWEPPSRVVLSWHPGSEETEASEVEVLFTPQDGGTQVVVEHRGWEAFGANAMARRRGYVGPNAWGYVLDHFANGVETRPNPIDLTNLEAAYDSFFATADQEGSGPPAEGQWNILQIIAHVALNDAAMLSVTQALVHDRPTRFENKISQDPAALARLIDACVDRAGLVAQGRVAAHQLVAAISRLSDEQLATPVHCHLFHDGECVLDQPMAWQSIAVETQAEFHLPAHIEQLRNLRA